MNRRGFLRGLSIATASGIVAPAAADKLMFLVKNPVSIIKPMTFADKMARFESIKIYDLFRTGDVKKKQIVWDRNGMMDHCRDDFPMTAQKIVEVSGFTADTYGEVPEFQYQMEKKVRELISDIAWEEGWLDQYRLASKPIPETIFNIDPALNDLIYNISPMNVPFQGVTAHRVEDILA